MVVSHLRKGLNARPGLQLLAGNTEIHHMTSERPVLSVCIATMNRTRSLDAQIASLLAQIETLPVEIVVIDATDVGKATTASWRSHPTVNYRLLDRPNGVDQDYDLAVRASVGDYCWLLPDDDRLRDGAMERLIRHLVSEPDLVLLNAAVFDANLDAPLRDGLLRAPMPSRLDPPVTAQALAPANLLLTFIGSIVIRRSVWIERMEERFLGSEFAHVGVILSKPLQRHVVIDHEPYLDIRYGAGHWESRWARVWGLQWPALVDSVVSEVDTPGPRP